MSSKPAKAKPAKARKKKKRAPRTGPITSVQNYPYPEEVGNSELYAYKTRKHQIRNF